MQNMGVISLFCVIMKKGALLCAKLLLSDASAAVATVRAALSELPLPQLTEKPKSKTKTIKFTKLELDTMSAKLRNYLQT